MGKLDAVIGATEEFLELAVSGDHSADILGAIRQYYIESDVFAAGISTAIAADTDRFSSTGGRARLFGAAVSDLLVFRCIGMMDYWAAVNESGAITAADDLSRFHGDLLADLRAARSAFDQPGGPVVAGGAANSLEVFAKKQVHDIADESASNVLGAALDLVGGVVPAGTSRTVIRVLHRFGRAAHLDHLLDWAQRILDLALNKLRRVFGPGFDAIVEPVNSFLRKFAVARGGISDGMFQVPSLLAKCDDEIEIINRENDAQRIEGCWTELSRMSERFDNWSLGLDIAAVSLKWGSRISVVSPPVAIALTALKGVLAGGAFVIGRYYLDSPELDFLPWGTYGVLSVLQRKNSPSNPEPTDSPGQGRFRGLGDGGF